MSIKFVEAGNTMDMAIDIIKELREYDSEREWFEFKVNWFVADDLGEYISALSNSAAIVGRKYAYFVWGIDDKTHEVVGTSFNCNQDVKKEPLKHYLARQRQTICILSESLEISACCIPWMKCFGTEMF